MKNIGIVILLTFFISVNLLPLDLTLEQAKDTELSGLSREDGRIKISASSAIRY